MGKDALKESRETQQEEYQDHWQQQVDRLWKEAQARHGGRLRIRPKRDALWLWKPLHWLLRIVTLGQSVDLVDGNYYFLLGYTLWVPGDGSQHETRAPHLLLSILSHEIDHLDYLYFKDHDARHKDPSELTRTSPLFRWLHMIKYLCWPVPFFFARYREKIERWGHERNLEQHLIVNDGQCARWYRKWLVMQFSNATYGWICTRKRAFQIVDEMIAHTEAAYRRGDLDEWLPKERNPPDANE